MSRRNRKRRAATIAPDIDAALGAVAAGSPAAAGSSTGIPFGGNRVVDIKIVAPSRTYAGRVENPDPVVRQFGTWDGICIYRRMFRQFPTLAGVCHLAADKACAIDATIKAGDETVGRSRWMRDMTAKLYAKVPDLHILNKKMALGPFFGYAATGKADWRIDEETDLLAPADLYDIPQEYLKFGPKGEEFVVTERSPLGESIEPGNIFYLRWGSRFTPYGEAIFQDVYLTTWYIQTVRDFGMQGLEILGRPIPWVEVPETIIGPAYDKLEKGLQAQYKYYVITRTTSNRTTVSFPSLNVLANGAAGRSELEYLRFLYGEIYIRILGVQMTQDKTGGSRALEDTRLEVISDKTPPLRQAMDQAWTNGWSNHIWRVNAPDDPPALYPKFQSDTADASIDAPTAAAVIDIMSRFAAREITRTVADRTLVAAGLPQPWVDDMLSSTDRERETLAPRRLPGADGTVPQEKKAA